ncbi:hypothetical protein [Streptomyces tendae]
MSNPEATGKGSAAAGLVLGGVATVMLPPIGFLAFASTTSVA